MTALPIDDETLRQFLRLLEERPDARAELRRLLLAVDGAEPTLRDVAQAQARTERHLASLTERMDQLATRTGELAGAQATTEKHVAGLAARMDQLTRSMDQLTQRIDQLTDRTDQLTDGVRELVSWQRGEAGRREGERYEGQIARRGFSIFQGGRGGSPTEPTVREYLERLLADLVLAEPLDEEHDPLLADVIWWKNGAYAVVEASVVVDQQDVQRAHDRARTLRRAGVARGVADVLPLVVGRTWATTRNDAAEDVRKMAERLGVAWWVGDDLTERFIAYRRLTGTG